MLALTNRYANALLAYAGEHGLDQVYRQALLLVLNWNPESVEFPAPIGDFLAHVPKNEQLPVLYRFLDLARKHMDLLDVEIISAVPLTEQQLAALEEKLIRIYHKQLEITTTVEPSLLGGLRIIVNNTVIDDSIKRKLMDMKNAVYKGVYFKQ